MEHEMYDYTGNGWSHRNSKGLKEKSGNHTRTTDSLQKTTTLGTSHIIRKGLLSETCSLGGVDHRWFNRSSRKIRENNEIIMVIIIIIIIIMKRE